MAPKKPKPGAKGSAGATDAQGPTNMPPTPPGTKGKGTQGDNQAGPAYNTTGATIPANLISALGLTGKVPTLLLYYPPSGVAHAPSNGKELWNAINQLLTNPAYSIYQQANLKNLATKLKQSYFPAGFTGTGSGSSDVFAAVTSLFTNNSYNLAGLTVPTKQQILGLSGAAQTIATMQSTIDQQTVALSNATAAQEQSAFGIVQNYLESWGLGSAAKDMWTLISKPGNHITNTSELLNIMRGVGNSGDTALDRRLQNAYNQAFPGLNTYNNAPGATHMTESAYQQYTAAIKDTATQYGAPMPTQAQIGDLLNHNVSAMEFQARTRDIATAIQTSDQNVRNILETKYGVTQAGLWDYMTTGSLPSRQRQIATAQMQDYAQRVGLTGLTGENYTQLGEMARVGAGANPLGYGVSQIQNALLTASRDAALTQAQPGQAAQTVSTQQLIGSQLAGFAGTSQPAEQVQVARAEQQKAAPFEKGGGFIETAKGVTGLGSART